MKQIKLRNGVWEYDPSSPLGPPGGFGEVFLGRNEKGVDVAIKKLHVSVASTGNRELVISQELCGKDLSYVIPYYDSGIDADTLEYFVVMAKAERSLEQVFHSGGAVSETVAITILTDIAQGLKEIGDIVHRDLKPGNVLFHEKRWKLADFGIAKFVEDTTSINTLKDCLSQQYAAPEQWRLERATKATDIYAFGCIAYALLNGSPPFISGDLRQRHISEEPPKIPGSSRMQQLVSLCLRKSPLARPSVDSVIKQLETLSNSNPSHAAISAVGADIAVEVAKKEADLSRQQTEQEARQELAKDAIKSLDFILETMFQNIESDAPVARRISKSSRGITLGNGKLEVEIPFPFLPANAFPHSKKNIICGALIKVEQEADYRGRSANLWYCGFTQGEFRWMEIPYFTWGKNSNHCFEPFGISRQSELQDADFADAPIMHTVQQAASPREIDREMMDEFINRWSDRLAQAARNTLPRPMSLPER